MDLNSTNVLILTYNAAEQKEETPPTSEEDKKDDTEDDLDNVNKDDKE